MANVSFEFLVVSEKSSDPSRSTKNPAFGLRITVFRPLVKSMIGLSTASAPAAIDQARPPFGPMEIPPRVEMPKAKNPITEKERTLYEQLCVTEAELSVKTAALAETERKLAQDFGVSRTPVREALAQLEREGFVRSVPRRGIYVVLSGKLRMTRRLMLGVLRQ